MAREEPAEPLTLAATGAVRWMKRKVVRNGAGLYAGLVPCQGRGVRAPVVLHLRRAGTATERV
jgi:hypothetical protein